MAKILLVEDDCNLSFMIRTCLEADRHLADVCETGEEALSLLKSCNYDLIVLDWGLPEMSGLEVCEAFRSFGGMAPIIMLTARGSFDDKVEALDLGADDYLSKPFNPQELLARVRALLRRPAVVLEKTLSRREIRLNPERLELTVHGQPVEITVKECALLELLMRYPNRNFSSEALIAKLWNSDAATTLETVRSHIKNLRRKIGDENCELIKFTRGRGYTFCDSPD
jgi:DNA-binding response OmpR family regulator